MLRELLKPRSYSAAQMVKQGNLAGGLAQVTLATGLRTGIAYLGILAAGFDAKQGLKAAIAGNLAITASVFTYYLTE